ncbi:hypothetical protein K3556_14975 [Aliiroseovarius sp. M344]|uniref:hypothetical protein n=1 Tax=Aliiroseovarius sp. M344 TaxID=2867010 RepID=UPI0021AE049C|nr:hypothetical protein [Aliiroseovarius sp. M344]UWQ14191.1 hypothetical protein K3556_14975 [Aliiroseovarius sp. M344]
MIEFTVTLLILIGGIWLIWQLFALVGDMAERRGQDRFLWQVVAVFINPISAMILLWVFCSAEDASGP